MQQQQRGIHYTHVVPGTPVVAGTPVVLYCNGEVRWEKIPRTGSLAELPTGEAGASVPD
jgi:hypothetical protein